MRIRLGAVLLIVVATVSSLTSGAGIYTQNEGLQEPASVSNAWGEVSEGFQLSAHLEKQEVSIGEAVRLRLTLKNITKEYRPLGGLLPERDYKLDIRDEQGKNPPLTESGRQLLENEGLGSQASLDLAAGQELQNTIWIDSLYDLTVPGTYYITAKRQVPRLDRRKVYTEVVSNTVKLTVREGFQLSARLEKQEIKAGEPILLNLTLKNMTQDYLPLAQTVPHGEYKLDVTIQEGKNPPLTKLGQSLLKSESVNVSGSGLVLGSGQEQQDVVRVDQIYDLSVRGTYFITARRRVGQPGGKGWTEVVSNTVTLIVTY